MSISFQSSIVLVLLTVVVSIAVTYYVYRHTVPAVPQGKRWMLIMFRSLAFTLTVMALFEPLVVVHSSNEELPAVAVLVDHSLSMSQQDRTGDRTAIVRSLLKSSMISRLASASDMRLLQFSHDVAPLHPDSLVMDGGTTDLSAALGATIQNSPSPLHSVILISDGNYNAGSNPLYDAERSRVPIYTVGIGDSTEQRDLAVSTLVTNTIGYVESSIPVDASLRASGLEGSTVTVSLYEEGKKIDEKNVVLPSTRSTAAEIPVQFLYTPRSEGMKKLTVAVTAQKNESTEKNNRRSVMIKILKNKMGVTVVAGSPSADVSAVMQTLQTDKNIAAVLFVQLPNGELKTLANTSLAQALTTSDCLILVGFPTVQSSASVIQSIRERVMARSLSTMFIAARSVDPQKVQQLEPILPITVTSARIDEQTVLPSLLPQHRFHAVVHMDAARFPLFAWEKLPPIYASFQTFAAKPEAQTLLAVKIQGVTLQNPLLVLRNVAQTKSLAMTGYGIFRWKLLAASGEETKGVFDVWFASVIRWLATRDNDAPFTVRPAKEFYAQGEPVGFTAQLYNENFQPTDNADVQLAIRTLTGEQASAVSLKSIGSGRYEGTSPGLSEGEYAYTAAALVGGDTAGISKGRLSVGEQAIEFAETKMNKVLLEQIAEKSGGAYFDAARFHDLVETILSRGDMKPHEKVTSNEYELWNLPSVLSVIVLLFATEWFLRKRWGML